MTKTKSIPINGKRPLVNGAASRQKIDSRWAMQVLERLSEAAPFSIKIRVSQVDVDTFSHATYSSYVRWQSIAVDEFLLRCEPQLATAFQSKRLRIRTTGAGFRYFAGANYGDVIHLRLKLATSDGNNLDVSSVFHSGESRNGQLLAEGWQSFAVHELKEGRCKLIQGPPIPTRDEHIPMLKDFWTALRDSTYLHNGIRVFFRHLDQFGKVHIVNLFEWAGAARESYLLDTVPAYQEVTKRPLLWVTAAASQECFGDAEFGDVLAVRVFSERVRRCSFDFVLDTINVSRGYLMARGRQTTAFIDAKQQKVTQIPPEVLEVVKRIQVRPAPS